MKLLKKILAIFSIFKHPFLWMTILCSAAAIYYWNFIASDRYVSEAHIIIQQADLTASQSVDFGGLILGNSGAGNQTDQLLLRDHLLSIDMLRKLDDALDLRTHYSNLELDLLSRMWEKDNFIEEFFEYYLSRIVVEFDDYAGVLIIQSQAFTPEIAHEISSLMITEGEIFMNEIAKQLAYEQVKFLSTEVKTMEARVLNTRHELLSYQNKHELISPQNTAENYAVIVNNMEAKLAELQAQKIALLGYLVPTSANIVELELQIQAIKKQIKKEKSHLTSNSKNSKSLNKTVEEYEQLQLKAQFAQEVYQTTLVAMEKGRIEASRTLKKMSILQAPTMPEYPLKPNRIYNSVVSTLLILVIFGILNLLTVVILDHKE